MQIGTQLMAFDGCGSLKKGRTYFFIRNDANRQRVLLLEFQLKKLDGESRVVSSREYLPTLVVVARSQFEKGIESDLIRVCDEPKSLPPWFGDLSSSELVNRITSSQSKEKHQHRTELTLKHLRPLIENLDEILNAESPDSLINAQARQCTPPQNVTRFRRLFYAYLCFGMQRLVLTYSIHNIGKWDRLGRAKKFGRPSKVFGTYYGFGSNDAAMIDMMLAGYRRFTGPGKRMSRIYHQTLTQLFGCVVQRAPNGMHIFVHPAGKAFPSLGQFVYRVAQVYPLDQRQLHKYGYTRTRNRLKHSEGRFSESVGNLMEKVEQDAYCLDQVARGYLPGSQLPPIWVVRLVCQFSGMIVGIGFSFGSETAAAYRMASFCAAIDKVRFASLFGLDIVNEDWPSSGISPHIINDRGPGSTAKADPRIGAFKPVIKEAAPSYAGQSKASVETRHPKQVKAEGKPVYKITAATIPQIAVQEINRCIISNNSTDMTNRLNPEATSEIGLPIPVELWKYFDRRGRNFSISMDFDQAVREFLERVELEVRDDGIYYLSIRYMSDHPLLDLQLQKVHLGGRFRLEGYLLNVCVRHIWIDLDGELIQLDAQLNVRDGEEQLFISALEAEQLASLQRNAKTRIKSSAIAVAAEYEERYHQTTGQYFDKTVQMPGRNRRGTGLSKTEASILKPYFGSKRRAV